MRLSLIAAVCSISAISVSAQERYDFRKNYPDARMELSLGGEYLIGSEAITVEFQNTFIQNGFIGQEMKDESFGNMDDRSVAASRFNYGITFLKRKQEQPDNFWFASLRNRSHYDTEFTKDLFGLYFYGNKPYAGQTADMSDMAYQSIKWQQAQFGIGRKLGSDSLRYWQVVGSVSLLNGQEYLDFETGRGTFYTDPDAEYIEMDLYMKSRQSDSSDYKFGSTNGFGASADLMISYVKKDHSYATFGFRDLGAIAWNSSSFTYTVDTLYRFEGAITGGFFDSLFLDIGTEEDFVNSFIEKYESGGFTTMIPLWIGAEYGREFLSGKMTAFAGFDYLVNAHYTPHLKLGGEYRFNKNILAGTALHYGGYANFGWELYGAFDLTGALILTAGTSYLGGIIIPQTSTAQGAMFGLKKLF